MTTTKRIGWIGLSILALLAALSVQIVASVAVVLPYAFLAGARAAANGQDTARAVENFMGDMGGIMGIVLVLGGV